LSKTLKQLTQDTHSTEAEIADQQAHLAELMRQHYMQGGGDAMKLMLNGKNPGDVARNIEYYGYIGRARAELIRQHRDSLARLQSLQQETRNQNKDLLQGQAGTSRAEEKSGIGKGLAPASAVQAVGTDPPATQTDRHAGAR
jgi:septal ring factor EnvC (AmiA/AmiB activator)